MKKITIATINHYIKPFNCTLIHNKKEHYFYFISELHSFKDSGVYVNTLNELTLSEWISELVHKIDTSW